MNKDQEYAPLDVSIPIIIKITWYSHNDIQIEKP